MHRRVRRSTISLGFSSRPDPRARDAGEGPGIGHHAGDGDPDPDGDYCSPVLNRLGLLLGAGHGGQRLLSQAVQQRVRDRLPEEVGLKDLGEHRLKDLLEPERVWQLAHPARRLRPLGTPRG